MIECKETAAARVIWPDGHGPDWRGLHCIVLIALEHITLVFSLPSGLVPQM
jgi:hypothetical protein